MIARNKAHVLTNLSSQLEFLKTSFYNQLNKKN